MHGPSAALVIRPATDGDVDAITRLVDAAYRPYVTRIGREPAPMTVDYASPVAEGRVLVAEDSGESVGVLVIIVATDHLLIENLAVDPQSQRRGIGTALLATGEAHARDLRLSEARCAPGDSLCA
jgi:N-acetylglutamate synthase-like GNAT family acetyltransferase